MMNKILDEVCSNMIRGLSESQQAFGPGPVPCGFWSEPARCTHCPLEYEMASMSHEYKMKLIQFVLTSYRRNPSRWVGERPSMEEATLAPLLDARAKPFVGVRVECQSYKNGLPCAQ